MAELPMKFEKGENAKQIETLCQVVTDAELYEKIHAHEFLMFLPTYNLVY